MKEEVREMLGEAAYEAEAQHESYVLLWHEMTEDLREIYRIRAEGAVKKLAEVLIPTIVQALLTESHIKEILETL